MEVMSMFRTVRSLLLLLSLICGCAASGFGQSCLIFNGCSSAMQAWENAVIEDYLGSHQLPSADRALIGQYAREELKHDLRSFAFDELRTAILTAYKDRSQVEKDMVDAFAFRIRELEIQAAEEAVNHKNALVNDMCKWKPDPEVAKAYGNYTYDGSFFCDLRHALFLGYTPPIFPTQSYFVAVGQKRRYFDPLKDQPGGLKAYQEMSIRGKLTLSLGLASIGIPMALALLVKLGVATSWLSRVVFPKSGVGNNPITAAIVIAIMIAVIVIAVYLMYEGQEQIDALGKLDQDLTLLRNRRLDLQAATADLQAMARDSKANARLTAAFARSTPWLSPDAPPPVRSSTDPLFVLTDPASGASVTTDRISYRTWDGSMSGAQMYGGWFLLGQNFDSLGLKIRYLWNGKQYTIDRSSDIMIVTKEDQAGTDIDCPPGPAGVSTAPNLTVCKSFTTRSVWMDLSMGQRAVSLAQKPAFNGAMEGAFSIGSGPQTLNIEAVGLPIPRITLNSPLPAGVTFEGSDIAGPGKARLKYDGVSGTGLTSTLNLTATSEAQSIVSPFTLIIASTVKIVPPTLPTVTFGVQAYFLIQSTGHPRPTFTVNGTGSPDPTIQPLCQMALVNNGNGTATVSGKPQMPLAGPLSCRAIIRADNGFTNDTITITFPGVSPPQPVLSGNQLSFLAGQSNSITIKTAPVSDLPVVIQYPPLSAAPNYPNKPPSWLQLVNHGNGTATLSGTPPADSAEFFGVELQILTDGAIAQYKDENVMRMHVIKYPVFTSPAYAIFDTVFSNYYLGTLSRPGTVQIVNSTLPEGLTLGSTGASYSIGGRARRGGESLVYLTASNSESEDFDGRWFRIIATEAPRLSVPQTINFYIGQTKSLPILAGGYPMQPIEGIPNAPGPMRMDVSGVLPNGLKLVSTDPDTGETTYGKLVLTGKATTPGTTSLTFFANNGVFPNASQAITVRVTIPGDVNVDGKVDCNDVKMISALYGKTRGSAQYDYNADYNLDGVIDVRDVAQVSAFLPAGTRCQ
jgi:hypothetical protein